MKCWTIGMTLIGAMAGLGGVAAAQDSQAPVRVESTLAPVKVVRVQPTAADAKATAKTTKVTYLGAGTSAASASMREQLKLPKGAGLVVDSVDPKSPAEAAGVKQHDVIEKLNDQLLVNTDQFTALVRSMKAGDEVTLSIIRQGERQTLKAKLGEHEGKVGLADITFTAPALGGENVIFDAADGRPMVLQWQGAPPAPRAVGGQPLNLRGNVIVRDFAGKQNTEWSDGQVRIALEREGDKTTRVTIKEATTGAVQFDGTPPGDGNPFLKAHPELAEKLKKAEEAAKPIRIMAGGDMAGMDLAAGMPGMAQMAGGRGKVKLWQDDNHVLVMRMMGAKPLYLLALSRKDGRTLYDGPVMTDEQRQSVPTEVSESFEMVTAHPDQAKEFGVEVKK